ncbi:hypothetical protein MNEG_9083 [Monoraphidium neglectum]|uniref:Uncharacterized protein n=1 Tax=Monoraphidium neglectum TaxID=145388 RepID=A0A0D2KTU7_9CHLO|nr:hypothetical protein MNEG_9083 [Monoraphidium neglectum]KIY98878.1 hypothetical protein MNEG_9083 [Monoraphidium neglectum]|eukprot:XP_013897898.1 hypothetical protein MNEG_9083 [Monoraphidium neglectum]
MALKDLVSCKSPIKFAKKPASSPAASPASAATTAKSPIKPTEPPPAPHTASASSNKGGDDAPQRSSSPSAPTAPTPSGFKTAATKLKTKCTATCDAVANPFTTAAAAAKLSALRLAFKGKLLVANKGRSGSTAADNRSDDASEYASANSATPSFLSLQSCASFSMAPDAGYYDAVPAFNTSADDGEVLLTVDSTTHTSPTAANSAAPGACPRSSTKAKKRGVAKKIVRLFLCGATPTAPAPNVPAKAAVCCSAPAPAPAAAAKPELSAAIAAKAAAALLRVSSRRRRPDQEGETAVAA